MYQLWKFSSGSQPRVSEHLSEMPKLPLRQTPRRHLHMPPLPTNHPPKIQSRTPNKTMPRPTSDNSLNPTKIEWCRNPPDNIHQGWSWNPTVGCNGVGCAVRNECWARAQAKRQKPVIDINGHPRGCQKCYDFTPHHHPERYVQPHLVRKPSGIAVSLMSDIFDATFSRFMITSIINIMRETPRHRYYILTKQPQNTKNYPELPDNAWVGVTVNRKTDLWRIEELRKINATIRYISFEPLYEDMGKLDLTGIDWVIIGTETCNGRPTFQPDTSWVRHISLETAKPLGIPAFYKDNLHFCPGLEEFPKVK